MQNSVKEINVETRTLEQLLKDLREEKKWTYVHIVEELNKLGLVVDEKTVKKWEVGLEYPKIEEIYKLSELYFVPSEKFVMAKTNSYQEGLATIHATFIKWICYITGISLKIGYIAFYVIISIALLVALSFFIENLNKVVEIGKENI
ncbi:MAG: helix-turn-helix transcriptional regulator [Clostridia bacterium]|nr:helix-turn-helix transcriptional regulator [Clostridia bacterium]